MRRRGISCLLLALVLWASSAQATILLDGKLWEIACETKTHVLLCPAPEGDFYSQRERGWFYGMDCRWVEKDKLVKLLKKEGKKAKPSSIPWKRLTDDRYLGQLTAKQFRELYDRVQGEAIMNPSREKVAAYMHMTDFMRRKALTFAYAVNDYVLDNPQYDVQRRVGTTSWSHRVMSEIRDQERLAYIRSAKDRFGLYLFVFSTCPHCHEQVRLIRDFMMDYGISVMIVAADRCTPDMPNCQVNPGAFGVFKVRVTPTIVMLYRKEDGTPEIQPLAAGLITEEGLVRRIYTYLKYFDTGKWEL